MTDKKTTGATAPTSQVPATIKARLDEYVAKTLEHLQNLAETGNLDLPKDYSMENAIKGASLKLQMVENKDGKPALEVCTATSVVNALIAMAVDGLSVWKQQGYFIVYGNKLTWQPDYRGHILLAKRHADVKEVNAQVIYEDDEFAFEVDVSIGRQKLLKHDIKFEDQDISKIKGAYAVVVFNDGSTQLTVMTIVQIRKAWLMGFGGGDTKAHKNFTDEMCKKTVINRATKVLIGSSDDSEVLDENTKSRDENIKDKSKKELNIQDTNFEEVDSSAPSKEVKKDESKKQAQDPSPNKVTAKNPYDEDETSNKDQRTEPETNKPPDQGPDTEKSQEDIFNQSGKGGPGY